MSRRCILRGVGSSARRIVLSAFRGCDGFEPLGERIEEHRADHPRTLRRGLVATEDLLNLPGRMLGAQPGKLRAARWPRSVGLRHLVRSRPCRHATSDSRVSKASQVTSDSKRTSNSVCDHGCVPERTRELPSKRVEAALRQRIAAGEWQPEGRMPSVAALADEYGVSRSSVAAALRRIADDGLIEIVPQWGTFLAHDPKQGRSGP